MPFDGANWEVPRQRPKRAPSERAFSLLLLFLGFCLLIMPISGAALVDIVNYLHSNR